MRSFVLFSLILVSLPAFSKLSPKLGDFATYKVTGPSSEHYEKKTLEEYDGGYDGFFKDVTYKITDEETTVISQGWRTKSSLEFAYVSDLEKRCSSEAGKIETTTVPAGIFKTCKIKRYNGIADIYTWVAEDVPFGWVRYEYIPINNPTPKYKKELTSFGNEAAEE